jgi:rare lipoprotein A
MRTTPPCIALLACAALCGALACAPGAGAQAPATASIAADPGALAGKVTRVRGALPSVPAGGTVQIQRLDPARGWMNEAQTVAGPGGAFVARWRPKVVGRFTVRAVTPAREVQAAATAAPTAPVTVYRGARSTWYGPGLYGRHTACGEVLSHRIMGLAHRTLPCGTPVEVWFGGHSVTVPVIDRGPFSNGARYDLTSATAQQLGLTETSVVGVVPQRGALMVPPLAPAPPYAGTGGVVPPAAPAG